jgi:hypothetical protein
MQIGIQEQEDRDFDWFCVDEVGEIGHFASAGFKRLPPSVSSSSEDLELITNYFENAPIRGGHLVDRDLKEEVPDLDSRAMTYLQSYIAMADRGMYSYDIQSYLKPNAAYFRVALPSDPIRSVDLPEQIRLIVERTVLKGRLFRDSPRIRYEDTVSPATELEARG